MACDCGFVAQRRAMALLPSVLLEPHNTSIKSQKISLDHHRSQRSRLAVARELSSAVIATICESRKANLSRQRVRSHKSG